ncbi:MAG: hypothetical protein KC983_10435, partial [Phycisphaerales bacterium]|nr:hypothetical protein [Phycisphaerales bacterium]
PAENPDLMTVAGRIPRGVICLVSALAFHEITTQIPHAVDLALPRGMTTPAIRYPPIRTYRFSAPTLSAGVEMHAIDGVDVRIFSPEKTLADCFKFRNTIGLDIALEALRTYLHREGADIEAIHRYARLGRVERVMRPYLEALL